ncbi:diaminopimelate epimerase [Streptomyces sp. NPDC001709]
MQFRKLHGAGNDFVLFTRPPDGTDGTGAVDWPKQAQRLCDRRTGVGGDGLVVVTPAGANEGAYRVDCFNADGSTATMCGNALRCAAWCASTDHGVQAMTLTMAGVRHHATVSEDGVWVTAHTGTVAMRRLMTMINGRPAWFDAAHTGTEHVVAFVKNVDQVDAVTVGRIVRHHRDLAPLGTNVNFVAPLGRQALKIRTYERGVEAETLSCGSGAVAAVVIARRRGLVGAEQPITVHNRAGTPLTVRPAPEHPGETYWIGGPVTHTFTGELA